MRVTHLIYANSSEAEADNVHYANKFNQMDEANIGRTGSGTVWMKVQRGGVLGVKSAAAEGLSRRCDNNDFDFHPSNYVLEMLTDVREW